VTHLVNKTLPMTAIAIERRLASTADHVAIKALLSEIAERK
jgi:hypothetical protein